MHVAVYTFVLSNLWTTERSNYKHTPSGSDETSHNPHWTHKPLKTTTSNPKSLNNSIALTQTPYPSVKECLRDLYVLECGHSRKKLPPQWFVGLLRSGVVFRRTESLTRLLLIIAYTYSSQLPAADSLQMLTNQLECYFF